MLRDYVMTFDHRSVVMVAQLDGLRRMTIEEARDVARMATRIPKHGRIINVQTLAQEH